MSKTYYRNVTIFTNWARVKTLKSFRALVVEYFEKALQRNPDEAAVAELRRKINQGMLHANFFIHAAGYSTTIQHMPGAAGGWRRTIEVLIDIFEAVPQDMEPNTVIDCIDRAVGIYETDQRNATIRTINPLWWLQRAFVLMGRLPFMALAAAGFDTKALEQSVAGKVVRFVVWLIGLIGGLIAINSAFF